MLNLNKPEPTPAICNDSVPVWPLIIEELCRERDDDASNLGHARRLQRIIDTISDRNAMGIKKYGVPLSTKNGRRGLVDAIQEALDLVVYLRQAIEDLKSSTTIPPSYAISLRPDYDAALRLLMSLVGAADVIYIDEKYETWQPGEASTPTPTRVWRLHDRVSTTFRGGLELGVIVSEDNLDGGLLRVRFDDGREEMMNTRSLTWVGRADAPTPTPTPRKPDPTAQQLIDEADVEVAEARLERQQAESALVAMTKKYVEAETKKKELEERFEQALAEVRATCTAVAQEAIEKQRKEFATVSKAIQDQLDAATQQVEARGEKLLATTKEREALAADFADERKISISRLQRIDELETENKRLKHVYEGITNEVASLRQRVDALPSSSVTPGSRWRHFKGGTYSVVSLCTREEDHRAMVVYQNVHEPTLQWLRPLSEWQERVDDQGRAVHGGGVPRFTYVGEGR